MARTMTTATRYKSGLNIRQAKFIDKYLELGNVTQAAIEAGYSENGAGQTGANLLKNPKIQSEILRRREEQRKANIATADEVMDYFSRVMRGEILDQFGLEAPLSERTRAAQELAKRTVDIENRAQGKADAVVQIKLDWEGMEE